MTIVAHELHVVDERGVGRHGDRNPSCGGRGRIVSNAVAQLVRNGDAPPVANVHSLQRRGQSVDGGRSTDGERAGLGGLLVERSLVAAADDIAIGRGIGGNGVATEMHTHRVGEQGASAACSLFQHFHHDVVFGFRGDGVVEAPLRQNKDFVLQGRAIHSREVLLLEVGLVALLPVGELGVVVGSLVAGCKKQAKETEGEEVKGGFHFSFLLLMGVDAAEPRRTVLSHLLELFQEGGDAHLVLDDAEKLVNADALLLHGVAETESDGVVFQRVVVDGDAVGCAHSVLTTVALADGVLLVVGAVEVELQCIDNLAGLLGQEHQILRPADQRELHAVCHRDLDWRRPYVPQHHVPRLY